MPELESQQQLDQDQALAIGLLVEGLEAMGKAMAALEAAGLDAVTALKMIPGDEPGTTLYEQMPLQIRLLLG